MMRERQEVLESVNYQPLSIMKTVFQIFSLGILGMTLNSRNKFKLTSQLKDLMHFFYQI